LSLDELENRPVLPRERGLHRFEMGDDGRTRYDKLAIVYCRGAAVLRAITIWLKHL
jgi:hypothetical protein